MKKVLFIILLIVCIITLTSCKKEKTIDYEQIYRYNLFEIVETLTEEEIMKQIEEAIDAFYNATYIDISIKSYDINSKQIMELKIDNKKRELYSYRVRETFDFYAQTIVEEHYENNEFSYYKEKINLNEPTFSKYETRSFEESSNNELPRIYTSWFIKSDDPERWSYYKHGVDVYGNTVIYMTKSPYEHYMYIPCMVIKDGKPIFFISHASPSSPDYYFKISYEKPKIEKPDWCDLAELKANIK